MTQTSGRLLSTVAAIVTTVLVYIGFLAPIMVKAARTNVALGPVVFLGIIVKPLFWLIASIASLVAFKIVSNGLNHSCGLRRDARY